ncbi:phosphoserine phosphatase [Burkholderiales bacterium]|nr:phosphoserine phosphatase [Burkholderiales bacterium]
MTVVRGATVDLVVQGASVASDDVAHLAAIADPDAIEAIVPRPGATVSAWRLRGATRHDGVREACASAGLDFAIVPRDRRLADLRVLALDMDSTLITIECIDEIADYAGVREQVSAITASAMRGEIDFRESLARRVGLLAGLSVDALESVYRERLVLSPGAETLLSAARAAGARTLLVSGGFTFFTERLRERLAFDATASNVLEVESGRLTGRVVGDIIDAGRKADALDTMRARHAGSGGLVAAIGDGANDVAMLRRADVSIAYRAKPVVRAQATHAIDHGGLDAVLNLFA